MLRHQQASTFNVVTILGVRAACLHATVNLQTHTRRAIKLDDGLGVVAP